MDDPPPRLVLILQQTTPAVAGELRLRWLMTNRSQTPILYSDSVTRGGYIETLLFDADGKRISVHTTGAVDQPDLPGQPRRIKALYAGFTVGREYRITFDATAEPVFAQIRYTYDLPIPVSRHPGETPREVAFSGSVRSERIRVQWKARAQNAPVRNDGTLTTFVWDGSDYFRSAADAGYDL